MSNVRGYKPKAYLLVLLPSQGKVYLTDGARNVSVESRDTNMPIVIPLRFQHWLNPFWKTDICAGKQRYSIVLFADNFFRFTVLQSYYSIYVTHLQLFYFSGGHLNVCLSPDIATFTRSKITKVMFSSPMEVASFLVKQKMPEDAFPGLVTAFLTFTEDGFHHYQLVIGATPQKIELPLAFCEGLHGYVPALAQQTLSFQLDMANFLFLQDSPVSAWVKLVDCSCTFPADMPQDLDLNGFLIRLRVYRVDKQHFQLLVEAIVEYENFTIEQANRTPWVKSTKAMPLCIAAMDIAATCDIASQLEILPAIKTMDPVPPSVSDSGIRFAVTRVLCDVSPASWASNVLEWLAHAKQSRHSSPAVLYDDMVMHPLTEFIPESGQTSMVIQLNGDHFKVVVGDSSVVKVDNPPAYNEVFPQPPASAPPLTREVATTNPEVYQAASTPSVITQPPSQASATKVSQPSSAGVTSSGQPTQQNQDSGKRMFIRMAQPTQKLKYSPHPLMSQHIMPGLPPMVAANLQMAFATNSQNRMMSAYNHFVKALGGRDPFLAFQPYDAITILNYFFTKNMQPATIANYMHSYNRWCELNNLTVGYKSIITTCLKGNHNGSYMPLFRAATGFKLPFSFATLKLMCNGLQKLELPPSLQAAVWSAALLAFWGLLRAGEMLCSKAKIFDLSKDLCASDIILAEDGSLQIWLKSPKVESYHGDIIELLPVLSYPSLCPIVALKNYLRFREASNFHPDTPLYLLPSGFPLIQSTFTRMWRSALRMSHVPDAVISLHKSHGLRASLPTILQMSQLPDDKVKILGRWKSDTAFNLYLKDMEARAKAKREAMLFCQQLLTDMSQCEFPFFLTLNNMILTKLSFLTGLPVFEDLDTQRQHLLMATSHASHAFASRAATVFTSTTSRLPGVIQTNTATVMSHQVPITSVAQSNTSNSRNFSRASQSSSASQSSTGASQSSDSSPAGPATTGQQLLKLSCLICEKTWEYFTQAQRVELIEERARHMSLCHDVLDTYQQQGTWRSIQITEDNGVSSLCEARWLPYPCNTDILCRKLPQQITPMCTSMELDMMGLPLASRKPIETLHNRVDNSLSLKMFSKERLINHEKLKKRKLDLVHGVSASSIFLDDGVEDLKSNTEAIQSCLNYAILCNYVDVMDKSPLALLQVAMEMFADRALTPTTAERLFSTFLSLKTSAAASGKPYPGVTQIKAAVQFAFPISRELKETKKQKTATVTHSKKSSNKPVYCYDYNNSGCSKSTGPTCMSNGVTKIHGCNKRANGKYCGLSHPRSQCTK